MSPFAAVLMAGGESRRMGRDKALLPLDDGRLLWQRQLAVLRELSPTEIFISGPSRAGFPQDAVLLTDASPRLGPLSGLVAALGVMHSSALLVLAVDLPKMTTQWLQSLVDVSLSTKPARGLVPQLADGSFEPLAAMYPGDALPLAKELLSGEDRSLQNFTRRLLSAGQVSAYQVEPAQSDLFTNWNHPGDYWNKAGSLSTVL